MLSNVVDLTRVLSDMARDGHPVTPGLVTCTSPYIRRHLLRFGKYTFDRDSLPEPLDPQPLPFELTGQAKQAEQGLWPLFTRIPNPPFAGPTPQRSSSCQTSCN